MAEWNPVQVSAVIPALNEEKTIGEAVQSCKPFADQVIVVDGRSHDRTPEVARSAGAQVIIDEGRGKGAAIKSAIPHIKGDMGSGESCRENLTGLDLSG